ncbi:MAG: aspartate aminotransferase family protein [Chloroflexi bacterium]|nr:MAG: aspartate aminotransferase family protein [Chloroflexota bacterium]
MDRARLERLLHRERERFAASHVRSRELHERARAHLLGGVPMTWMTEWAGDFPLFLDRANGARLVDVDGNEYVDFCLGDTGAMAGHAPAATAEAVERQMSRGVTAMLPTEDALWVADELTRRFGLDYWSFALTATDANRWALRLARRITGRPKVLVFNWCYHGTVDEAFVALNEDGVAVSRSDNTGPAVDPTLTTKVVEFNDIRALEEALAPGDVACVLAEPALTNIGIVLPEPGFHAALREVTRRTGTLLIIDETHTLSAGPGGATRAWGLEPDMLTVGKALAGGVPVGVYGLSAATAGRLREGAIGEGVGGTLAGNALSLAAMRATLTHVLTEDAYARMIPLAGRFVDGVQQTIDHYRLPWSIVQLGARAEYRYTPAPPRTGGEAMRAGDDDLDAYLHLALLNRGVLMTPFHNMALMSPATTAADVDRHTALFREVVADLVG